MRWVDCWSRPREHCRGRTKLLPISQGVAGHTLHCFYQIVGFMVAINFHDRASINVECSDWFRRWLGRAKLFHQTTAPNYS
jgi:hypothetical protein